MTDLLKSAENFKNILLKWLVELIDNNDNHSNSQQAGSMQNISKALLAIDEASELTKDEDAILLASLIEALRNRFWKRVSNRVDLSQPHRDFLCVLLSTTPIIVNFPLPEPFDKSRRTPSGLSSGRQLFPPIYNIDTIDIFSGE